MFQEKEVDKETTASNDSLSEGNAAKVVSTALKKKKALVPTTLVLSSLVPKYHTDHLKNSLQLLWKVTVHEITNVNGSFTLGGLSGEKHIWRYL